MFSQDDIIEIHGFLPPAKQSPSGLNHDLPLLIKTVSGQGFVTGSSLRREFEHMVTRGSTRISVASASSRLGVDVHVVLRLVRADSTLALLSRDQQNIIPKQERDAIVESLKESLDQAVVVKIEFTELFDIDLEYIQSLLHVSSIKDSLAYDMEDYLLSKTYWTKLSNTMSERLVAGKDGLE